MFARPCLRGTAFLLILAATLVTAACQPVTEQPRTYRHSLDGVPGSLDPTQASDIYTSVLVLNIFDTLYRYRYLARPYEPAPNLAAELPEVSEDGRSWIIRLRRGVRFADDPVFGASGTREVQADDVLYSIRRHFDPATRSRTAWLLRDRIVGLDAWGAEGADPASPVAGLEALDPYTVRITLTEPFPQLLNVLAMAPTAIVPREAVDARGQAFGRHPLGSGPFQLVHRDESRAVLVPNPRFEREPLDLAAEGFDPALHGSFDLEHLDGRHYPMIDRLEFQFITEPSARWYSFISGEVDQVTVPPEQTRQVLDRTDPPRFNPDTRERFHGLITPESGFVFYGFNMANPDIGHHPDPARNDRNRALRCAIRQGFDWQQRLDTFDQGLGTIFPGALPPVLHAHEPDSDLDSIRFDPQLARQRLEQAGWSDADWPALTYGLESNLQQRQMYEQFRGSMMALGMPSERLRPRNFASFADYLRAIGRREIDIFLMSWTLAYPDPQYSFQIFYGPNAAPGANSFNYQNPEFDRLFEKAAALPDSPQRRALYQQLNSMLIQDCVIVGSMSRTRLTLWNRRVSMLPDRDILGGFFIRFIGLAE